MKIIKYVFVLIISVIALGFLAPLLQSGSKAGKFVNNAAEALDSTIGTVGGAVGGVVNGVSSGVKGIGDWISGIFNPKTYSSNIGSKTYSTAEDLIKNTGIYSKGFHRNQ